MESTNGKLMIAIAVVTIIIISSIILFPYPSPKVPIAGVLILKADDLQNLKLGYWGQTDFKEFSNRWTPNSSSEAFSWMGNGNVQLFIWMAVFANDTDCHAFLKDGRNLSSLNATKSLIGDEGYWAQDNSQQIGYIFREGRIFVGIGLLYSTALGPQAYDDIISIAKLQLDKINRY